MKDSYWRQFLKTGSVQDYLAYRNSLNNQLVSEGKNERSNSKSDGNSHKGSQDEGK